MREAVRLLSKIAATHAQGADCAMEKIEDVDAEAIDRREVAWRGGCPMLRIRVRGCVARRGGGDIRVWWCAVVWDWFLEILMKVQVRVQVQAKSSQNRLPGFDALGLGVQVTRRVTYKSLSKVSG